MMFLTREAKYIPPATINQMTIGVVHHSLASSRLERGITRDTARRIASRMQSRILLERISDRYIAQSSSSDICRYGSS